MKFQAAVAMTLALITVNAAAQQMGTGYGVGATNCGAYIAKRRTPNQLFDHTMSAWFAGFVTARNMYSAESALVTPVGSNLDGATMLAYVDKYCRDNPTGHVVHGLEDLIHERTAGSQVRR